jgi:hypothetical protein
LAAPTSIRYTPCSAQTVIARWAIA